MTCNIQSKESVVSSASVNTFFQIRERCSLLQWMCVFVQHIAKLIQLHIRLLYSVVCWEMY